MARLAQPQLLDLDTAAARIRESAKGQSAKGHRPSPWFFVVGAGVSCPSIPLAWGITTACQQRAESLGLACGGPPPAPSAAYGYWLTQAYPDPDQRRAYFRGLIEGRPISEANLRLAHLLASGAVTNIAVTTNFDDFISRGLHLFGRPHVVCDHPATSARIDLDAQEPQIVHVHGTYWFYDLVNTEVEMGERAGRGAAHPEGSGPEGSGPDGSVRSEPEMGELLDTLLRSRSPLVVGYSGWEGDVIMTALRRRLRRGLKHTLYWFCFDRDSPASMPPWLALHPNVCFVVPDADAPPSRAAQPADRVFDALLRSFRVAAPRLTTDPLGFVADQLRGSMPEPPKNGGAADPYYFGEVLRRVERGGELEQRDRKDREAAIERVRDAVRRSRYGQAASQAANIPARSLDAAGHRALLDALWPAAARGGAHPKEELRIYDTYLTVVDRRPRVAIHRGRLAAVLIARSAALLAQGKSRNAVRAAREALERLGADKMPRARLRLQLLEARGLLADRRPAAALEVLRALDRRGRSDAARLVLVQARRYEAIALRDLERDDEAKAVLDELIARLERLPGPLFRQELVSALTERAEQHDRLGDPTSAAEDRDRARPLA